jgi:alpha-D-ribose 1-methylphosphonate 5-triphosphate synthase subunit PhnL
MKTEQEPVVILQNSDQHFADMRTVFGMCHTKEAGTTVFKCATTCADLPNCPTKIVPKGWHDASVRQVGILQDRVKELQSVIKPLQDNAYEASNTIEQAKDLLTRWIYSGQIWDAALEKETLKWVNDVEKEMIGE